MHLTIQRKSIKSLRIRVLADESVIVSVPKRVTDSYVEKFIESRKPWIHKALEKMRNAKRAFTVEQGNILLHGEQYKFIHDESLQKRVDIDHEQKQITSGIDLLTPTKQKLRYKSYAKSYLVPLAKQIVAKHKLSYNNTYIRDQKTKRWTCSSKKNIGLNWKLIKMPERIIEYVICHELAHLREMNHSPRFWKVVDDLYPNKEEAIAWMKKYGLSLQ